MPEPFAFTMREVCAKSGLSARTVRYYEELGLLPGVRRRAGGRRVYGADEIERLRFITRLKALGLSLEQIGRGLEAARPAKGRCVWRRAGRLRILDDTYNANPTSVSAALQTLAAAAAGRRVVVLGDMLELGEISVTAHREMGRAVAGAGAAEFVGMGRWAQVAVEAARQAGLTESHHVTTFEDTVALLLKRLAPGDAVLVKGSRGMRMERVVDALMARFGGDDA